MKTISNQTQIDFYLEKSKFPELFFFDILPYIRIAKYDKNEYVIRGDQPLTRLFYLVDGTAKLYGIHKNGKQSLIDYVTPPRMLGETELFDETKLPYPLVALTRCVFIEVDLHQCRSLLLSDARFLRNLCDMMLKRRVAQNQKYMNLAAYPSRTNLAACLLLLQNEGIFTEKYTEIADYLSISYRHLMHLIADLCAEGILERAPEGLRILDLPRLRELADDISDEDKF